MCLSEEVVGFDAAYAMSNGTVILRRVTNPAGGGTEKVGLSRAESSFILDEHKCVDGCSVEGGTCVNGKCTCFIGCTGVDCAEGPDYCRPTHHGGNDDDDD